MTDNISEQQIEQLRAAAKAIESEQLDEAEKILAPLKDALPEHPDVWQLTGALAMRRGQPAEAISHLTKVTQLSPAFLPAWVSLFQCHHAMGDLDHAVTAMTNAVEINSEDHNLLLALADTQLKLERFADVITSLDRLPSKIKHQAPIMSVRAAALQGLGRLADAESALVDALSEDANDNRIRLQLAGVQQTQRRFDEAAAGYQQALEQEPGLTPARFGLAICCESLGRFEQAIEAMRQVVSEDPAHVPARALLGSYLERTGQVDEAEKVLNEALKMDPEEISTHLYLAQCEGRRGQFEEAAARLEAVATERVPDLMQIAWHAEHGRLLDRLGRYEKAMASFDESNRVAARIWKASNPGDNAFMQRLQRSLNWLRKQESLSWSDEEDQLPEPQPVFLIGFPRTGSTLLGRMLNAHSQCVELDEYPTLNFLARIIDQRLGGYPDALGEIDAEERDRLRNSYMAHMSRYGEFEGKRYVIDKLPMNSEYLPLIARVFPGAKVILSERHPLAAILSAYMQPFQLNPAMVNFHDLSQAAKVYAAVDTIIEECLRLLPNLALHRIRYEAMVDDAESTAKSLLQFLELDFEPAVMDPAERTGSGVRTPSYRQVDQAVYAGARDHWQHYEPWLRHVREMIRSQVQAYESGAGGA